MTITSTYKKTVVISGTSDRTHNFTFPWLSKDHVIVTINGSAVSQDNGSDATKFEITGASGNANVVLGGSVSIAANDILIIERVTPKTVAGRPVTWTPGPVQTTNLETDSLYALYALQEAIGSAEKLQDVATFTLTGTTAVNVDATGVGTGVFSAASALTMGAVSTVISPTVFSLVSGSPHVREAGTYLFHLAISFEQVSADFTTRFGVGGSIIPNALTLPADYDYPLCHTGVITATGPTDLDVFVAVGAGGEAIDSARLVIQRIL